MEINEKYMKVIEEVSKFMEPHPVYIIGGFVRDTILGKEPKDIDFSTPASPEEIEDKIRLSVNEYGDHRRSINVGKKFGCLRCRVFGEEVDITSFRTEHYEPGNRKPNVEFVKSINEDLSRRDFQINAIAIRLHKGNLRIIDPFCGVEDIENKIIKCVGSPKQRFKDDPLRILRGIRLMSVLDFDIEENTLKKLESGAINLLNISKERIMEELDKILLSDNVEKGLRLLFDCGIFKYIIPELDLQKNYNQNSQYHDFTLSEHTIMVVKEIRKESKDLNLLYAGLLHDSGKIFCKTENSKGYNNYISHEKISGEIVEKYSLYLKWSKERSEKVKNLVLHHLEDLCELRKYDNLGKIK